MSRYQKIARCLCIGLLAIGVLSSLAAAQNSPPASAQSDIRPDNVQQSQSTPEALLKEWNTHIVDLFKQGKYGEATLLAQKSVELAKSAFGADDLRLATSMNNLALLYDKQGKYSDAESLYKQALRSESTRLNSS